MSYDTIAVGVAFLIVWLGLKLLGKDFLTLQFYHNMEDWQTCEALRIGKSQSPDQTPTNML